MGTIGTYIFAGVVMFCLLYTLLTGGARSRHEVVVLLLIVLFLVLLYWAGIYDYWYPL